MGIPPPAPRQALPAMGWEEGGLPGGQGRPLPGRGETPQGILRPKRKEKSCPACGSRVSCALWFSTRVQLVHTEHPQVLMRPPQTLFVPHMSEMLSSQVARTHPWRSSLLPRLQDAPTAPALTGSCAPSPHVSYKPVQSHFKDDRGGFRRFRRLLLNTQETPASLSGAMHPPSNSGLVAGEQTPPCLASSRAHPFSTSTHPGAEPETS